MVSTSTNSSCISQLIVIYCVIQAFPVLAVKNYCFLRKPNALLLRDIRRAWNMQLSEPTEVLHQHPDFLEADCSCQCVGLFPSFHHHILKVGPCACPLKSRQHYFS